MDQIQLLIHMKSLTDGEYCTVQTENIWYAGAEQMETRYELYSSTTGWLSGHKNQGFSSLKEARQAFEEKFDEEKRRKEVENAAEDDSKESQSTT